MLNFVFKIVLLLPDTFLVEFAIRLLETLLTIHIKIHLVLQHDVNFLLKLCNACDVTLDLGILSPCGYLLLLED